MDSGPPPNDGDTADLVGPYDESSEELLRMARAGSRDALERLGAMYLPRLRRWAKGRIPQAARDFLDTDDLVQDVLAQTIRRLDGFEYRRPGSLQAYLRQALKNRIQNALRDARRKPVRTLLDSDVPGEMASPLEEAIGKETLERYEAALRKLKEEDREAVVARVEMAQSYEQIAILLGKSSADAARMSVSRALARLARDMADG